MYIIYICACILYIYNIYYIYICVCWVFEIHSSQSNVLKKKYSGDKLLLKGPTFPSNPQLRLALLAVLKLEPGSLGVLAPVCSTMGFLASSVTKRNCMLPLGDLSKLSVADGNLLAFRNPDSKEIKKN